MIKILVPLITAGCFSVLASYSYGTIQPYKMVTVWATPQAAALADVWGFTTDSVDEPIVFWSK